MHFWGTRGAVPSPSKRSVKYGGNTSCVEVRCGETVLVFDAGSGFRLLGHDLQRRKVKDFNLYFTHFHYDHICGLPFFRPLFDTECNIRIWSGHLGGKKTTKESIREYMVYPYFPVGPEVFNANVTYHDFTAGETLSPAPDIELVTCPLNHPGGSTAYRINFDGRSFCYVTDTEHSPGKLDERILALIDGADVMIYDATYADTEYPRFVDFGHSTWEEGIRLSRAAGVKRLGIFHHRPSRTDKKLDAIGRAAKKKFANSFVTRDGQYIRL